MPERHSKRISVPFFFHIFHVSYSSIRCDEILNRTKIKPDTFVSTWCVCVNCSTDMCPIRYTSLNTHNVGKNVEIGAILLPNLISNVFYFPNFLLFYFIYLISHLRCVHGQQSAHISSNVTNTEIAHRHETRGEKEAAISWAEVVAHSPHVDFVCSQVHKAKTLTS